jgi:hypothetical protein
VSHEVHGINTLKSVRVVDPQVVLHHCYVLPLALVLQADQELPESVCVVALVEDLIVNQSSL